MLKKVGKETWLTKASYVCVCHCPRFVLNPFCRSPSSPAHWLVEAYIQDCLGDKEVSSRKSPMSTELPPASPPEYWHASPFPAQPPPLLAQSCWSSQQTQKGPMRSTPLRLPQPADPLPASWLPGRSPSILYPAASGTKKEGALVLPPSGSASWTSSQWPPPNGSAALAAARLGRCTESTEVVLAPRIRDKFSAYCWQQL